MCYPSKTEGDAERQTSNSHDGRVAGRDLDRWSVDVSRDAIVMQTKATEALEFLIE